MPDTDIFYFKASILMYHILVICFIFIPKITCSVHCASQYRPEALSYTYSMTAHSPTLLIHTDYATLPTQCGKTDKDDQYTQTHTDPTVHVM